MSGDGDKCSIRIWRYNSSYFKILEIGNNFNWKLTENTAIVHQPICVSSLSITNNSTLNCIGSNNIDLFRILCKQNLTIVNHSTLSMNENDGIRKIYILCDELYVGATSKIQITGDDNIDDEIKENTDASILIIANHFHQDGRIVGTVLFGFLSKHENMATNPTHDYFCRHACNRCYDNSCCEYDLYSDDCLGNGCACCHIVCHSYGCCIFQCICDVCKYNIKFKEYKTNSTYVKWYREWNRLDVEIPVKYNMIEIFNHQFDTKNIGNKMRNKQKCFSWWALIGALIWFFLVLIGLTLACVNNPDCEGGALFGVAFFIGLFFVQFLALVVFASLVIEFFLM
eukprot:26660_1